MNSQPISNVTRIVAVGIALVTLSAASFAGTDARHGHGRRHKGKDITLITLLPGGSITRGQLDPTLDMGLSNEARNGRGRHPKVKKIKLISFLPGADVPPPTLGPTLDEGLTSPPVDGYKRHQVSKDLTAIGFTPVRVLPGSGITRTEIDPTMDSGLSSSRTLLGSSASGTRPAVSLSNPFRARRTATSFGSAGNADGAMATDNCVSR